jgi:hypothetical protein
MGMAKGKGGSKSGGGRNDERPNGKAYKKIKKIQKKTGRTIDGYLPSKIAERAKKRAGE